MKDSLGFFHRDLQTVFWTNALQFSTLFKTREIIYFVALNNFMLRTEIQKPDFIN